MRAKCPKAQPSPPSCWLVTGVNNPSSSLLLIQVRFLPPAAKAVEGLDPLVLLTRWGLVCALSIIPEAVAFHTKRLFPVG